MRRQKIPDTQLSLFSDPDFMPANRTLVEGKSEKSGSVRLEGETKELEGEAKELEGEAKELESEAKALEGEAKGPEGKAKGLEGEAKGLRSEAKVAEGEAKGLEGEAKGLEGETKVAGSETKELEGEKEKNAIPQPEVQYDLTDLFNRLARSDFRSSFHLKYRDRAYIDAKGLDTIRQHAKDFVAKRLAPAVIPNDGKQTPMRGHPVFLAQHATGCCCRGCFYKWHHIPAGRMLTPQEQDYAVAVLMTWITNEYNKKF